MTIAYHFEIDDDLLIVQASGSDENLDDVKAYGMAVIDTAREHGCRRILCDERNLEYRLGTLDTYQYAKFIAAHATDLGRVAIVSQPEGIAEASFWGDVMVNRGIIVRAFRCLEKASAWLTEPSDLNYGWKWETIGEHGGRS